MERRVGGEAKVLGGELMIALSRSELCLRVVFECST